MLKYVTFSLTEKSKKPYGIDKHLKREQITAEIIDWMRIKIYPCTLPLKWSSHLHLLIFSDLPEVCSYNFVSSEYEIENPPSVDFLVRLNK